MRLRRGLNVRIPGRRTVDTSSVWCMGDDPPAPDTYGGGMRRTVVAVLALAVITGCSSSSLEPDAAIACGWNEPDQPVVSALEASPDELAENAERANTRLEAARRVANDDSRFSPLVEAMEETANFAAELATMPKSQIARIPNSRWDFAKYAQAAARDQCEQLSGVVESQ
jgi:hypothetical protein